MRWWSDSTIAKNMLGVVGGDDVAQGVATSVLGYHAIVSPVVFQLSKQTLVDAGLLQEHLNQVDIEPVAKAISAATNPIMGVSSDKYGELLASAIHKDAIDASIQLATQMTNAGLTWPQALERISYVYGVDSKFAKSFANANLNPNATPNSVIDSADRALMLWAKQIGMNESSNTVAISKVGLVGAEEDEFNQKHPRDEAGRFTSGRSPRASRLARLDRRNRRLTRLNNDVKAAEKAKAEQKQKASLSQLSRMLPQRKAARLSPTRTAIREPAKRLEAKREFSENKSEQKISTSSIQNSENTKRSAQSISDISFVENKEYITDYRHRESSVYVPMSLAEAQEFAQHNRLAVGAAQKLWDRDITGYTPEAMGRRIAEMIEVEGIEPFDIVLLRIGSGAYFTDNSPEEDSGGTISPGTILVHQLAPITDDKDSHDYEMLYEGFETFELKGYVDKYGEPEEINIPVMGVEEYSVDEYKYIRGMRTSFSEETNWRDDGNMVSSGKDWRVGKSEWDESEHPRAKDGTFTRSYDSPSDPRIARARRRNRRNRRNANSRGAEQHTEQTRTFATREAKRVFGRVKASRIQEARINALVSRIVPNSEVELGDNPDTSLSSDKQKEIRENTYKMRASRIAYAESLLRKASQNTASQEENAALRKMFLSQESDNDLSQSELKAAWSQLAITLNMHEMLKSAGATAWNLKPQRNASEVLESVKQENNLASVIRTSAPYLSEVTGFGANIMSPQRAEEMDADAYRPEFDEAEHEKLRNKLASMSGKELDDLYDSLGGDTQEITFEEMARKMGYKGAARHAEKLSGKSKMDRWSEAGIALDPEIARKERERNDRVRAAWEQRQRAKQELVGVDEEDDADRWLKEHDK